MELVAQNLDAVLIFIGAVLGATKASLEFDKDKHCAYRGLDVLLGVFVGTVVAYHYGSQFSVWLMGLVALVGGVSGAMLIEVFMQVLPAIARSLIAKYIKKFVNEKSP